MTIEWQVHPISARSFALAEGPAWERESGLLRWVDIDDGAVWAASFDGERLAEPRLLYRSDLPVGFCVRSATGRLVVPQRGRVLDLGTGHLSDALFTDDATGRRFNDAIVDAQGRVIAGTLTPGADDGARDERLARLEADGTWTMLRDGIGLSNGLAFSPDGQWLYHVDTTARTISRAQGPHFDVWRPLIRIDDGYPDGMTVDATGDLWVAIWGGGEVRRYSPSGEQSGRIRVPAKQVTSAVFAGPSLTTLVVTTARVGLTADAYATQPLAGRLFAASQMTSGC
ncbi:SMP-30/gluconolactonase/LRE family protein [Microbacterium sp.]|uniref:SMP-30/gluconolactonase/LRE family protein n=1 Tax=Microbacterium sp. TaxID=51671 RepID=UPI003F6F9DDB